MTPHTLRLAVQVYCSRENPRALQIFGLGTPARRDFVSSHSAT